MKDTIRLLKGTFDFLNQLSEKQLNDLISKNAKLKLVYPLYEDETKATNIKVEPVDDICTKLSTFTTREAMLTYFESNKLTKTSLKEIAHYYEIPIGSKDRNQVIIEKVVEGVIGSKLRYDALLSTKLK